ncbi:MAG: TetR/AcrR family transcriptional regulator [Acidimicrobiia bacterium]|jgi:AcrR family transcriptional regulator
MSSRQRAEPLAPDERRRAILEAVIPLVAESGGRVTTSEIAKAAGVAEGTIFRVFDDKASLIHEALKASFDPAPTLERIAAIDRALTFEERLREAAGIIVERSERVHALAAVLRSMPPANQSHEDTHKAAIEANSLIFWGLTRLFADESDELAVEPARAAAAFRGLLYSVSFPLSGPNERATIDEVIEVLLHGILSRRSS